MLSSICFRKGRSSESPLVPLQGGRAAEVEVSPIDWRYACEDGERRIYVRQRHRRYGGQMHDLVFVVSLLRWTGKGEERGGREEQRSVLSCGWSERCANAKKKERTEHLRRKGRLIFLRSAMVMQEPGCRLCRSEFPLAGGFAGRRKVFYTDLVKFSVAVVQPNHQALAGKGLLHGQIWNAILVHIEGGNRVGCFIGLGKPASRSFPAVNQPDAKTRRFLNGSSPAVPSIGSLIVIKSAAATFYGMRHRGFHVTGFYNSL